jgi:predicted nucleic acid-binding protein
MRRILLDSVILIDHLNQRDEASDYLKAEGLHCAVSPVTRAEVLVGVDEASWPQARFILDRFDCVPVDGRTGDLAAELRRRHRWKLPDALQMAVATQNGMLLATRNTRDFSPAKHDNVLVPYRLKD